LLAHAVLAPALPHKLGFIAAVEFTAPRWKDEFRKGQKAKKVFEEYERDPNSERETNRRIYCAQDAIITAMLKDNLEQQLAIERP